MKLTTVDSVFDDQVARTPTGMAFWAGTGPEHTTCRECIFFKFNGYRTPRGMSGGLLKKGQCKKFMAMTGIENHKLEHHTPSCKYFEENPSIPTISDKGKS